MNRPSDIDYRRQLVLGLPVPEDGSPWPAGRLCQAPLNYARPEQWNGFIPPETCNGARNESPRRKALLQIVADAEALRSQLDAADALAASRYRDGEDR